VRPHPVRQGRPSCSLVLFRLLEQLHDVTYGDE